MQAQGDQLTAPSNPVQRRPACADNTTTSTAAQRIDAFQRQRIIAHREMGMTRQAIADQARLSEVTVLRICRGYR